MKSRLKNSSGLQNADMADDADGSVSLSVNSGECFDTSETGTERPGFADFNPSFFRESKVTPYTMDSPKFIDHGPVRSQQKYIQVHRVC